MPYMLYSTTALDMARCKSGNAVTHLHCRSIESSARLFHELCEVNGANEIVICPEDPGHCDIGGFMETPRHNQGRSAFVE